MDNSKLYSNECLVYLHINPVKENVFYVGMSSNTERPYDFRHRGFLWDAIVKKYGKPLVQIYKTNLSFLEAAVLEAHLIKTFGRRRHESYGTLVNHKIGDLGTTKHKHTDEAKAKISRAFGGENGVNTGRKATEEAKRNMSLAHKGRKWSDQMRESIEKFYEVNRKHPKRIPTGLPKKRQTCYPIPYNTVRRFREAGRTSSQTAFCIWEGTYKATDETKNKISIGNKGKVVSQDSRAKMSESHKIRQLFAKKVKDNKTGIVYDSMTKAGEVYGVSGKIISSWVAGKVVSRLNQFTYEH